MQWNGKNNYSFPNENNALFAANVKTKKRHTCTLAVLFVCQILAMSIFNANKNIDLSGLGAGSGVVG